LAHAYTLEPPAMAGVSWMKKRESPDLSRGESQKKGFTLKGDGLFDECS
jgi:hypothetical protein